MLATGSFLKCCQRGLLGGCWKPQANYSKLLLYQITSVQLGPLALCACMYTMCACKSMLSTAQLFYDVFSLYLPLSLSLSFSH